MRSFFAQPDHIQEERRNFKKRRTGRTVGEIGWRSEKPGSSPQRQPPQLPAASGSTQGAPAKPSFADVARAFGERTYDQLQQEKQSNVKQLERLHRHSNRNNLVVFGAVMLELLSVAAKHTAFQASKRLRDLKIRLDEDLTPQRTKTRRGLSTDFQCLNVRGYKPFFRVPTLRYRNGTLIRKCAGGKANKVVAAAAQAARATAPPPPSQEPRLTVAMDPSALLHQFGISIDH
ncbi:TPA: hypothetical protein ACH3X1_005928 [Trebouxia sp. C0004]